MNKKGCVIDGLKMMNKKVVWIKKIKMWIKKIKKLWIKKIKGCELKNKKVVN